jgi:hypothetical protein
MSDKKENGVILQKGFSKEILITTAPPDFKPKPPNPVKGEPFFLMSTILEIDWSTSFVPALQRRTKEGNTHSIAFQLEQCAGSSK